MLGDRVIDRIEELRRTSRTQRVLRLIVLVAPLLTFMTASAAQGELLVAGLLAVAFLAAWCAAQPDSHLGLPVVAILVWHWLAFVDDPGTPLVIPGAAGVLAFHVAMAAAASTHVGADLTNASVRRWWRRSATVGVAVPAGWALTAGVEALDLDGGVVALVLATGALAATAFVVGARTLGR